MTVTLCRVYGYTPEQVADMTLPQMNMLLKDPKEIKAQWKEKNRTPEARAARQQLAQIAANNPLWKLK